MPGIEKTNIANPFSRYEITHVSGDRSYAAGFPSYPANFSRDTLIAGILASHPDLLASQLEISAHHQGKADDRNTGERIGRIHHEMPGAQLPDREGYTTYNACDTTALFLIGAEGLSHLDPTRYEDFVRTRKNSLRIAAEHILEQISDTDGLFHDTPPSGVGQYCLRVTYWKDSILPHADGKVEPMYPVKFALAHFIAARGILSAGRLLDDPTLEEKADEMFRQGIAAFINTDGFTVYRDGAGHLVQSSSDELHALAFIPPQYADLLPLDHIVERADDLASQHGYMCTPLSVAQELTDGYHGDKVWVFEQALIHYGSNKFNLPDQAVVAEQIAAHIGEGQELFGIVNGQLVPEGNDRQLWSVAADVYFAGDSLLTDDSWL